MLPSGCISDTSARKNHPVQVFRPFTLPRDSVDTSLPGVWYAVALAPLCPVTPVVGTLPPKYVEIATFSSAVTLKSIVSVSITFPAGISNDALPLTVTTVSVNVIISDRSARAPCFAMCIDSTCTELLPYWFDSLNLNLSPDVVTFIICLTVVFASGIKFFTPS